MLILIQVPKLVNLYSCQPQLRIHLPQVSLDSPSSSRAMVVIPGGCSARAQNLGAATSTTHTHHSMLTHTYTSAELLFSSTL